METNSAQNSEIDSVDLTSDFAVGAVVFEKFEILAFISSDGKRKLFKAKDLALNSIVALKVLITDSRSEKDLMRFQSEARIASKLNHPGIATIFDFGFFGSIPYLTMEFVDGESLQSIIKQKKTLPPGEFLELFLELFIQVSSALVHAHKNGVVHRDIKPENILVAQGIEGNLQTKVVDFGIAKVLYETGEDRGQQTTHSTDVVGSPLYMSPEQTRGHQVTAQSDTYSLGCVMWESLIGNPPLQGETAMETILLHQNTVPKNLSDCVSNELPSELANMIANMLEKQPGKRPDLNDEVIPLLLSIQEIEMAKCAELFEPEPTVESVETVPKKTSS